MATTYMETGSVDPAYNLAFEEYVLTHRTEGDYLLLWQNENTVVVGQNQNAEAEINRDFVERNNVQVVRRTTGGGAVYHDLGNLNYSFLSDWHEADPWVEERFARPIVDALRGLGLQAEVSGRNDILVEGRKVSGTARRIWKGRVLYHGTLLFDSDPDRMAGALRVDPEKMRSKGVASVRSRTGNIRSFLKKNLDLGQFWRYLRESLLETNAVQGTLTSEELQAVEALKQEKYATWEWTFGRSPHYQVLRKHRFPGGSLEIDLQVEHGVIADIRFFGDFLAEESLEPLEAALKNCLFRTAEVRTVLERFDLARLFGTITREQVLQAIFYEGSDRTDVTL